ncbi:MAG: ParA family protein [Sulfuritalea sp.]|nr:ParA family protein [Sulfuritalea sp.]
MQALEAAGGENTAIIDCCPFLGVLSLNAIFASDRILVPVSSDYLSLRGALQIEHTLKALEPVLKRRIERRCVLTLFRPSPQDEFRNTGSTEPAIRRRTL